MGLTLLASMNIKNFLYSFKLLHGKFTSLVTRT